MFLKRLKLKAWKCPEYSCTIPILLKSQNLCNFDSKAGGIYMKFPNFIEQDLSSKIGRNLCCMTSYPYPIPFVSIYRHDLSSWDCLIKYYQTLLQPFNFNSTSKYTKMAINVNRSVSDPFYRYKMPRLIAKVEGKGNGIKTVIVNMVDVAKAIGRPPTYPTKYFGCELGAQTQFDFKNDRFIVNGSHEANKLQDLLDSFIKKFVLCPECENPETDLFVAIKKNTITQKCKACGYQGVLEFNHKLNTFIIKNPPNLNPSVQGSSLTEGKKRGKGKKGKATNGDGGPVGGTSPVRSDEDDTDVGNGGSISTVDNRKEEADEDDGEDWALDTSKEAVRARMHDLTDGAKSLTINDDLEKSERQRLDIFYHKVKADIQADYVVAKEILGEAERLDVKTKAPLILAELLFDEKIYIQVKKYRILLLMFTLKNEKAQKNLLVGIEQVIALHESTLLPKVPNIFQLFYESDLIEEKVFLEWNKKVSKKYIPLELSKKIHEMAQPFITWLSEAEEEDDDEEDTKSKDSEDDLEIEYNDRVGSGTVGLKPKQVELPKSQIDADELDVDIDAI